LMTVCARCPLTSYTTSFLTAKPSDLWTHSGEYVSRDNSAALSIRTVYRPEGAARPYEDVMGADGFLRYKWRGDDPDHAENRALRAAMEQRAPMIWFFGVGVAQYQPVFPVFIFSEESEQHQFAVATEVGRDLARPDTPVEAQLRRYIIAETKRRLHQPVFRATVMRAYETRCAVCALRHGELLDAAHIVADSEEAGIPVVRNGLALCKIHHAAYDSGILGIRPDKVVEIRTDLLSEIDGPMLQHGLKERHDQPLMALPRAAPGHWVVATAAGDSARTRCPAARVPPRPGTPPSQ